MKKLSIGIASILITMSALAGQLIANGEIVAKILSLPEVQKHIASKSVTAIKVSQENVSTTWTYTLNITSVEPGLGPNGPSSHPCFTKVVQKVVGGVAGNSFLKPVVDTVCAANAPRF